MTECLFKFGSWQLNPFLVIKISKSYGRRGSDLSNDRKIYRDKNGVPFYKGWYRQEPYHHPLYEKIYNRQPWYVRWYALPTPNVGRWNDGYVKVQSTDDFSYTLTYNFNADVDIAYERAMKNWTEALSKFTVQDK